jgi:hypothetical protein
MAAVRQNGKCLEHASEELKDDRALVMAAVSQNGNVLQDVSNEFRRDMDLIIAATANCWGFGFTGALCSLAELKQHMNCRLFEFEQCFLNLFCLVFFLPPTRSQRESRRIGQQRNYAAAAALMRLLLLLLHC